MMPTDCRKQTLIASIFGASILSIGLLAVAAEQKAEDDSGGISVDGPVLLPINPAYGARRLVPDSAGTGDEVEGPGLQLPAASGDSHNASGEAAAGEAVAEPPAAPDNAEKTEKKDVPAAAAGVAEATSDDSKEPLRFVEPNRLAVEPKRELTPAFAALRDRVRKQLAYFRSQPLSMQDNTPTEILSACMPFGCQTEVLRGAGRINGITCLCWDYPCAGFDLLRFSEGRIAARVGYGAQERPGQFLALLAMSRVQMDYPLRVDEEVRNVADLVEYEKLSCRADMDLSMKLIALSYYAEPSHWKNSLGETWSIERMIECEMGQPIVAANDGGTARLMGLSYAVDRRVRRGQPLAGQYARAAKFTTDFQQYALGLQNPDGSWHPQFFTSRGQTKDAIGQLRSTGHILEWLAFSLPYERLEDPRMVKSIEYVGSVLASQRYQNSLRGLNTREIDSAMHALRALAVYNERYFKPADPVDANPAEEAPAKDSKPAAARLERTAR